MTPSVAAVFYQLVALVYASFAAFLVFRGSRTRIAQSFGIAQLGTAAWAQTFILARHGLVSVMSLDILAALRDGGWLLLSLALMYPIAGKRYYWWTSVGAAAGLLLLQLLLTAMPTLTTIVAGVRLDAMLVRVCVTILGFAFVENVLRNASKADFWALKHWAIGLSGILLFQLVIRVPEFLTHRTDLGLSLATPLVFFIAFPLFVVSTTRIPKLQLRFHSSRAFIFHTATLLGAGILLQGTALAAWYVRTYGGTNATALAIVVAFAGIASIAGAISSGTVRSGVKHLINEYFFAFKYDYRVEWEKVIRGLTVGLGASVAERALRVLCDLLDSPGGAIWLYRDSWRQFILAAKLGAEVQAATFKEEDAKIDILRDESRTLFLLKAIDKASSVGAFSTFIERGWVIIPLRQRSSLIGFAILAQPRVERSLDWEDEALVRTVAMQVSAYLIQEETSQSLADARQLEDFNKRFAFIVHDIKNTIGQLRLMVGNISEFGDRKEFRDDMVITVGNAVDRLNALLASLTTVGSQSPGGASQKELVELNKFLEIFCSEKRKLGQSVIFQQHCGPATVYTDPNALRRVLEHVLSNALEASPSDASVNIGLNGLENEVLIKVKDCGRGMTQQFINEELFRPLRTTKRGGSGLGAFQIRELMRSLGGDVSVQSDVGKGTEVSLSLPCQLDFVEP